MKAKPYRRRHFSIIWTLLIVILLGCGRPKNDNLSMRWVVDPNEIRPEQIKLFNVKHPEIKVNNDPDAGAQRVLTQLAGGVPPEVFAIYSPQSASLFARKDVLEDLRPWVKKYNVDMNAFWPELDGYIYENGDRQHGRILGFPDNCGCYVLFYNRKLFRDAGIPYPTDSWTWEQFTEAARKLTKSKDGHIVQFGTVLPPAYLTEMFVWQAGGSWYNADGTRCMLDTPEAKSAFEWWAALRMKDHVAPSNNEEQSLAALGGWGGSQNLFAEQKAAMIITGRWLSIEWRKKGAKLDWDVAPVPHDKYRIDMLESKIYAIPRLCKKKELAFMFLRHLISPEDEMLVANYGDGIPSVKTACYTPQFLFNPQYPNEKHNRLYLDEMKYSRLKQQSKWVQQLDVDSIRDDECDRIWQKEITPSQAAQNIARRINQIIRRNIANPNLMD